MSRSKTTPVRAIVAGLVAGALASALAATAPQAAEPGITSSLRASTPSDRKIMRSAMRAAPRKVSAAATIVAMAPDGTMRTVRQGTNGFTCMPDTPVAPGPSAMCLDKAAMQWAGAWMGHKTPAAGQVGLIYMLAGGTDASNTDPYAKKPESGNHWIKTGPHIMVVGADPAFYDLYPKSADPDTATPYVMWAGTPYQHLMIPIK